MNPHENFPDLKDGEEIKRVLDAQGMEQLMGTLGTITAGRAGGDGLAQERAWRRAQGQGSMEAIIKNLVALTETMQKMIADSAAKLDADSRQRRRACRVT